MTGTLGWALLGLAVAGEGELRYAPQHSAGATRVAVSAPQRLAVVAGHTLDVWDLDAGAVRLHLGGYDQYETGNADLLMVDGALLRLAGRELALWDLKSEWSRRVLATEVYADYLAAGGRWVAAGNASGAVWLANVDDGQKVEFPESDVQLYDLALAPDGKMLAIARMGGDVEIYAIPSKKLVHTLHRDGVEDPMDVAWGPRGPAVYHRHGEIAEWTLGGRPKATVWDSGSREQFERLTFGADGKAYIGVPEACGFKPVRAVRDGDVTVALNAEALCISGQKVPFAKPPTMTGAPLWGSGHTLATDGDQFRVWDLDRGALKSSQPRSLNDLDGPQLLALGDALGLLPLTRDVVSPPWFQPGRFPNTPLKPEESLAASPDLRAGALFTPYSVFAQVKYFTGDDTQWVSTSFPDWGFVNRLSRDGRWLADTSRDSVRVFDLSTRTTHATLPATDPQLTFSEHKRVAMSPDGGLVAYVDGDGMARVQDLGGKVLFEDRLPAGPHDRRPAFSPEGDALAVVGDEIFVYRVLRSGDQVQISDRLTLTPLPSGEVLVSRGGKFSVPEARLAEVWLTLDGGKPVRASELKDRWVPDLVSAFWKP